MLKRLAAAIGALALVACATPAATTGPRSATLREGDIAPDGTVVRCRKVEVIGSRFGERTCKSLAAWADFDKMMAEQAKQETDKLQRVGSGAATNSGG